MKSIRKLLILITVVGFAILLFSCKDNTDIPDDAVSKPAFNAAISKYETLENRGSDLDIKFTVTLYGAVTTVTDKKGNESTNQNLFVIGQNIKLRRMQNNGKIYVEGNLSSCDVSDDIMTLINAIVQDDADQNSDQMNILKNYLNGNIKINFRLGYDGKGNYNLKLGVKWEDIDSSGWFGVNQSSIDALLAYLKYNQAFDLSEFLMLSTYIDPNDSKWIDEDTASKFWSESLNAYNYEMKINDEQLINTIFNTIDGIAMSFDKTEYEDPIKKYNKYSGYLKNWITVGDNGIAATVNENNLPNEMTTCATIFANIDTTELKTIIYDIMPEDNADESWTLIKTLSLFLLKGINGENDKIGISLQLLMEENYFYDDENLSLADIEDDMFSDCTVEKENRKTFIFDKESEDLED